MQTAIERIFETHPFVASLAPMHRGRLVSLAREETWEAGRCVLRQDAAADSLYLVCRGQVSFEVDLPRRGVVQLEMVEAPEVLGWPGLVAPFQWSCDVRAVVDTHLVHLDGHRVRRLCERDPSLEQYLVQRSRDHLYARQERIRIRLAALK